MLLSALTLQSAVSACRSTSKTVTSGHYAAHHAQLVDASSILTLEDTFIVFVSPSIMPGSFQMTDTTSPMGDHTSRLRHVGTLVRHAKIGSSTTSSVTAKDSSVLRHDVTRSKTPTYPAMQRQGWCVVLIASICLVMLGILVRCIFFSGRRS